MKISLLKKIISFTATLILCGVLLIPSVSDAQAWGATIPGQYNSTHGIDSVTGKPMGGGNTYSDGSTVAGTNGNSSGVIDCSFLPPRLVDCAAEVTYYITLKPASWVLWLSGTLFNVTLNFTLNFGTVINDQTLGLGGTNGAIYIGWSTIRDFINVSFIFILLYSAIATILDLDGYNTKKIITKIVLAALLLNFSLFFTKAIIDLSNILALQFYSRILTQVNSTNGASMTSEDAGLSAGFLNAIGLKSLWGGKDLKKLNAKDFDSAAGGLGPYKLILICIIGSLLILVFAFVLFLATIQFLFRSLVLIVLMLTSAVGFLGGSIPGVGKVSDDWWKNLKDNAIFAPAYMAMLYMVCKIIFGANSAAITGKQGFAAVVTNTNSSSVGLMFWFFLVIGLLVSVQVVAGKFASKFGSGITKGTIKWGKGFAAAVPAAGGRVALGNAGRILADNSFVKKLATTPGLRQLGGQRAYDAISNLKNVKVGGKSYKDAVDDRAKRDTATFERLGETTVRRRENESDVSFNARKVIASNKAVAAQAKFGGFKTKSKGGVIDPKNPNSSIIEFGLNFDEKHMAEYKKEASKKFGSGRRKAASEVIKKANPANKKENTDDLLKKASELEKKLADEEKDHKAEEKIYEDALKKYFKTNEQKIKSGHVDEIKGWNELKKALSGHRAERKSAETSLENIQKQIREAEAKK